MHLLTYSMKLWSCITECRTSATVKEAWSYIPKGCMISVPSCIEWRQDVFRTGTSHPPVLIVRLTSLIILLLHIYSLNTEANSDFLELKVRESSLCQIITTVSVLSYSWLGYTPLHNSLTLYWTVHVHHCIHYISLVFGYLYASSLFYNVMLEIYVWYLFMLFMWVFTRLHIFVSHDFIILNL